MSDDEAGSKKSGYRLEVSPNNRAGCKGPKPCKGTKIQKGEIRMGTLVDFQGHTSWAWRHWGCTTKKVLSGMKTKHPDVEDVDGYEDLDPSQQAKISTAWETGHVADEDIPDSARKPEGDGSGEEDEEAGMAKKKKKTSSKKRATKNQDDGTGAAEEKPVKKRKKPSKTEGSDDEVAPVKRKRQTKKKTKGSTNEKERIPDKDTEIASESEVAE